MWRNLNLHKVSLSPSEAHASYRGLRCASCPLLIWPYRHNVIEIICHSEALWHVWLILIFFDSIMKADRSVEVYTVARSSCMQTVSDPLFFLDATDTFAKSMSVYRALRLFQSALVKYCDWDVGCHPASTW